MLVMCVACSISSAVAKLCLGCAGYLRHPFAELGVLRFIERAFLSKHMIGTYNHSGSESLAVLSFCLGLWLPACDLRRPSGAGLDLPLGRTAAVEQAHAEGHPALHPLEVADWQAQYQAVLLQGEAAQPRELSPSPRAKGRRKQRAARNLLTA